MNKNTILFVVLSMVIVIGGMAIQRTFFPSPPAPEQPVQPVPEAGQVQEQTSANQPALAAAGSPTTWLQAEQEPPGQTYTEETNRFQVTFSNKGGAIVSLKLKEHLDGDDWVDIIYPDSQGEGAFNLRLGDETDSLLDTRFFFRKKGSGVFEFYQTFLPSSGVPFTLTKTYTFKPDDYMFEIAISLDNSENVLIPLNQNGYAYTLEFGPQLGPSFEELDANGEMRTYFSMINGNSKDYTPDIGETQSINDRVSWAALAGKYFAVAVIPDSTLYRISMRSMNAVNIPQKNILAFSRPAITNSSSTTDVFRVYAGPKNSESLEVYNTASDNGFGITDLNLQEISQSSSILWPLEWLIVRLLKFFYMLIPNYGIDIIFMAIVIKLILIPFTKKSYESTGKMQALNPKMAEIREKYKDNPQRVNAEIAALFKKEGVNPMGGCLPVLFQMPILFAVFSVFRNYFDFRGAVFIPGWITDLSAPEAVYVFSDFTIPFLGWNAIRILPVIYVCTQMLYSRTMQVSGSNAGQMKMMTTVLPIVFFFVLYNFPSGLLLYWIVSNILITFQQLFMNKNRKK